MKKKIEDLETPCLIVDKQKLDNNCAKILKRCKDLNIALRPHVKTPKSINIVRIALNNKVGPITVSTLQEAEYFASSGFKDILYAVGIVPSKLRRITKIKEKFNCDISIILDSIDMAKAVVDYSIQNKVYFKILIEIDSGEGRGGIKPTDNKLLEISSIFNLCKYTSLSGVMTHAGHSYNTNNPIELRKIANIERDSVLLASQNLKNVGQSCSIISLGSTPTVVYTSNLDGITEVRCGVYMLWDLAQASKGICKIDDIAITVLASIIGHNYHDNKILVDAGALAMSKDISANQFYPNAGYGVVCEANSAKPYKSLSLSELHQEHGTIKIDHPKLFTNFPIGSLVRILPNHSCLTCAGHQHYNILENNVIVDSWSRTNGW